MSRSRRLTLNDPTLGDRVRIWQKISHGRPEARIAPARKVASITLNVALTDEMPVAVVAF